jgi:hypothetical protein
LKRAHKRHRFARTNAALCAAISSRKCCGRPFQTIGTDVAVEVLATGDGRSGRNDSAEIQRLTESIIDTVIEAKPNPKEKRLKMRSKFRLAIAFVLALTFGTSAALANYTSKAQNSNSSTTSADSSMMKTKSSKRRRHTKRRRRHVRRSRSTANANGNTH